MHRWTINAYIVRPIRKVCVHEQGYGQRDSNVFSARGITQENEIVWRCRRKGKAPIDTERISTWYPANTQLFRKVCAQLAFGF